MDTFAALLLLTCWIWIPLGLLLLAKLVLPIFAGKSAGQWAAERDARKYDNQMEKAAYQHQHQVGAATRYIKQHGTDWLN